MAEISIIIAFLAGIGSFFAPCILPMVPAFLAYISGTTLKEINVDQTSSASKINKSHGTIGIEDKYSLLKINVNNSNDIVSLLGPPSTKSKLDNFTSLKKFGITNSIK